MSEEFQLALAFDTDDPTFTRGFECGVIWFCCVHNGNFRGVVHAGNAEMILRIVESLDLPLRVDETGSDDWMSIQIGTVHEDHQDPGEDELPV